MFSELSATRLSYINTQSNRSADHPELAAVSRPLTDTF